MHKEEGKVVQDKNPSPIRNGVSILLILVGLCVIAIPIVGKIQTNQKQEAMMENFYLEMDNVQVADDSAENSALDEVLEWGTEDANQAEINQNAEDIQSSQLDEAKVKKMPTAIGIIKIDKIDVSLAIAEGVSLEVLKFAIGHMPGTAALGEIGNCALAGHRSHSFGTFFNRLDEVAIGDDIVVQTAGGTTITYEVYEKIFVKPDDLSVLNGSSKYKVLTLITCHPEINPTSRLILHAKEKL
ncbi:MAG: class D sortase [Vallitaleaceae bacterium]|nr:class D sortase [Vallitaleaceae bacterium]